MCRGRVSERLVLNSIHLESIVDVEGTISCTTERIQGCSQQNVELRVTKVTLSYIMLLMT